MATLALTLESLAAGVPCVIPSNWRQGRTAYGGLSAAMALYLVHQGHTADLPALKAAQVSFVGPVTESAIFQTEILRRGRSVTQVGVDARVDSVLALRATFVFGAARASAIRHCRAERPEVDPPGHYRALPPAAAVPGHFQNFDVRFIGDATPVSAAPVPELLAWVRLREPAGVRPEIALLASGDCLPPAAMATFAVPAPISSMTWSIDFAQPAAEPGWLLQRSRSLVAADGYSFQLMEVWDARGELVMLGTQTVAIFT